MTVHTYAICLSITHTFMASFPMLPTVFETYKKWFVIDRIDN